MRSIESNSTRARRLQHRLQINTFLIAIPSRSLWALFYGRLLRRTMVAFTEQSIPLGLKQLQNFTSVLLVVLLQCTVPHRIRLHCFTQVPLVTYLGIRSAWNMVKFRNCIQNLWQKGLKYPIRESWRFRGILNSVQTALILRFLISEFLPWSSSPRKLELNYPPSHISVFILFLPFLSSVTPKGWTILWPLWVDHTCDCKNCGRFRQGR